MYSHAYNSTPVVPRHHIVLFDTFQNSFLNTILLLYWMTRVRILPKISSYRKSSNNSTINLKDVYYPNEDTIVHI